MAKVPTNSGRGNVAVDPVADILEFDALPPQVRRALREASVDIASEAARQAIWNMGVSATVEAIREQSRFEAAVWRDEMKKLKVKLASNRTGAATRHGAR